MLYKRFGIYMVNFDSSIQYGSVQRGYRPAIIVSNDQNNHYAQTVQVVPLTSAQKKPLPVHINLMGFGLTRPSTVLCEQVQTVPKSALSYYIGYINDNQLQKRISKAIAIQFQLSEAG